MRLVPELLDDDDDEDEDELPDLVVNEPLLPDDAGGEVVPESEPASFLVVLPELFVELPDPVEPVELEFLLEKPPVRSVVEGVSFFTDGEDVALGGLLS